RAAASSARSSARKLARAAVIHGGARVAPIDEREEKEHEHHRRRAQAPLAPGVDHERLEIVEPGREQHAPRREGQNGRSEPAGVREARLQAGQHEREHQRIEAHAPCRDGNAEEHGPAARLHRFARRDAAGERTDDADLVEREIGAEKESGETQERHPHPSRHVPGFFPPTAGCAAVSPPTDGGAGVLGAAARALSRILAKSSYGRPPTICWVPRMNVGVCMIFRSSASLRCAWIFAWYFFVSTHWSNWSVLSPSWRPSCFMTLSGLSVVSLLH